MGNGFQPGEREQPQQVITPAVIREESVNLPEIKDAGVGLSLIEQVVQPAKDALRIVDMSILLGDPEGFIVKFQQHIDGAADQIELPGAHLVGDETAVFRVVAGGFPAVISK